MIRVILVAAALALAGLCSCSGDGGRDGKPAEETAATVDTAGAGDETAPRLVSDVTFRNLDGEIIRIADYGRKILMVNYMETWNADSKALIPIMNTVQRKFHVSVTVLGILSDVESIARARSFAETNGVKFEILLPHGDPGFFGRPRKLPTTHVVTREDALFMRFDGLHRGKLYEDFILSMYRRRM